MPGFLVGDKQQAIFFFIGVTVRYDILNSNTKYKKLTHEKGLVLVCLQLIGVKCWIHKDYIIYFSIKSRKDEA